MDYKFSSIIKKSNAIFFAKNSYPQFEYINPTEYFTLLENNDIYTSKYSPNAQIINVANNTFVLKVFKIIEIITETGLKNGISTINILIETGDGYFLNSISSTKLAKINYANAQKVSKIEYNFEKNFNINELSSVDTVKLQYRHISLLTPSTYEETVSIDKIFKEELCTTTDRVTTKTSNTTGLNLAGNILFFNRLDVFGNTSKTENIFVPIKTTNKFNNSCITLNFSRPKPTIFKKTDSILNGYNSISRLYKNVNINNISLVLSRTLQTT